MNNGDAHEQDAEAMVARLNALVEELECYPDSEVREKALDLVQIIVQLYGEALRRIVETIHSSPLKDQVLPRLSADDVVRAMLAIHGLLPVELRERVASALGEFRSILVSQGADAELISVEDGVARLRLMRSGKGAPSIAVLKSQIEEWLMEAAPDLAGVEIEGLAEQIEATAKAALYLKSQIAPHRGDEPQAAKLFQIKRPQPDKSSVAGVWVPVIRTSGVQEGQFRAISFDEHALLVCRINGEFYGFRNSCADGGGPLDDALLEGPMLTCACHGYGYDLRRNGACVERPDLRLESLPLIVEDEKVKVAL